jgi:hypothetical protein
MEWSELLGECVSELEDSCVEDGSRGKGIDREPRGRGTSSIEGRYLATTSEDTTDWEDLVGAVVNCRVCELAIAL